MKKIIHSFVVLLMLFIFSDLCTAQAWRGRGRVYGTLTDTEGKPIPGATVKFVSEKYQTGTEVTTDDKGKWIITGIRGGIWNVDFIKEGYQTRQISAPIQEAAYNKPFDVSLEKAVAQAQQTPEKPSKLTEATQLMRAQDYQGAVAKYQEAIQEQPTSYQIYGDMGVAYYKLGQIDKALENYKMFLQKEKEAGVTVPNSQIQVSIASIYLEKQDFASAKKYLEGVDESTITDPTVFYNLGVGYANAKDTDNAIKYFQKSVQLDPKFVDGYYQLGLMYVGKNDNAKAAENFKKVIEVAPNSDSAKEAQEFLNSIQQ